MGGKMDLKNKYDAIEYKLVDEAANKATIQVDKEVTEDIVPKTHPMKLMSEIKRWVYLIEQYLERMKQ